MTLFLLAGSYDEYQEYMKERSLTRGVFYVSGLKRLEGRTIGPRDKILIYGTFHMRHDSEAILERIEQCKLRT